MTKTLRNLRMPAWQSIHLQARGSGKWQHTADVPDPSLCIYRAVTKAMLLKYFRMSMEVGRLPSLVGRECFRSTSPQQGHTFEDAVIFVHDMEKSLLSLEPFYQQVILWRVLHDYSGEETASLLRCTRQTVARRLDEALDKLSLLLIRGGLIRVYGTRN